MATVYGLTPTGFVKKRLQDIKSEMESSFRLTFGDNINLGPESVFGQMIGINSERESLIWELAEAVYNSQNPNGATGISVDNILALSNLRRLLATPTRTDSISLLQGNGITLYGLVLYGTAGTVVQAGSIIQNSASPPIQFTTDTAITIQAAVNAVQNLYLSNTPDVGTYSLILTDHLDTALTTPVFSFETKAAISQLKFSSVPVSGTFDLRLTRGGIVSTLTGLTPAMTAGTLQAAINGLAGYTGVIVTGSYALGFEITFATTAASLSILNNTMGVTITPIDSVKAGINNLLDGISYPFTDVEIVSAVNGMAFLFGSFAPLSGQVATGSKPQPIITVATNSLQMGITITNILIQTTTVGQPAQGVGTATCTETGPNYIAAGTLNVIGSVVSGWTGVTNQLDCVTGTNLENDTEALVRRSEYLQAQANGPLNSIIQKVSVVSGVTACIGFQNLNGSALQRIDFSSVPVAGSFQIILQTGNTAALAFTATSSQVQSAIRAVTGYSNALVTGAFDVGFTIDFNGDFGGQEQPLIGILNNSLGVTVTPAFDRPGHSFEIVVQGGADSDIAKAILGAAPAGIQSHGSTSVIVYDDLGNAFTISFSRPVQVPIYVVISLNTDLTTSASPKFNLGSISTIISDIVAIGNSIKIGGTIIGFGTNGLVGAFNDVQGIEYYTIAFGRTPSPVSNANVTLQPEEAPIFESFNVQISYV